MSTNNNTTSREGVSINLRRRTLAKVDFAPHTTFKVERELDTWLRNYCFTSGRTFRSVVEQALTEFRQKVELAPPGREQ